MVTKELLIDIIEPYLKERDFFLVDISISKDSDIDISFDSIESTISIDNCAQLSRSIETILDEQGYIYSLTVGSAGLDRPLMVQQQYRKHLNHKVIVVLKNGQKLLAELKAYDENGVTLFYTIKEKVEGKKRKVEKEVEQTIPFSEIKQTKVHID